MKVCYPHMGYLSAPIAHMLENLNVQVVKTPPITRKTLELGSLHSPEGACLPYKITLGNFIEATGQGADTVVSLCGAGKCRFGFFSAVQKAELAKWQAVNFHTLDTEHLLRDLYRFLRQAAPTATSLAVAHNIALALKKLKALDTLNDAKNRYGARTPNANKIIDLCAYGAGEIADGESFAEVNYTRDLILHVMESHLGPSQAAPPKIALVGEFYVLLEPYVNHWIENTLVKQGIEVKKFVYTGNWACSKILLQTLGLYNEEKDYRAQARPYFNHHVGGDGLKSVGTSVWSAKNGYDGIIHIFPFGCMPEVVAQYAMKNVCADYRLPLLSLSIDEHASDIGIITRVEAFADCIKRKKAEKGKA